MSCHKWWTMRKSLIAVPFIFAACTDALPDESVAASPITTTHFVANGNGVDGFITSGNNGGFMTVDENLSNGVRTVVMAFALTFPDPLDATKFTQKTGTGLIPTSNFTSSLTSGTLNTTTTFYVDQCTYSTITGLIGCVQSAPVTFNLTWTKNNLASFTSRGTNENTFGCITISNQGNQTGVSANVNGTWAGLTSSNDQGTLHDSHLTSVTRDFTDSCH